MNDLESEKEELDLDEEQDDVPYVEYDISVSPSDPTLELLANQVERGDIIIPFYQRRYVWKIEQASKLIESFLMGLPVPQIFLYVNEEDQFEVIDGQQRVLSVKYFLEQRSEGLTFRRHYWKPDYVVQILSKQQPKMCLPA
ncbi:MAG: DUF262 domain-containing protein [Rubritalea sp.]